MGGDEPAHTLIAAALAAGKSVVTANKHVVAHQARSSKRSRAPTAAAFVSKPPSAAGTPVLSPIAEDLAANEIREIRGIVNGTTNFILTAMRENGAAYADVLAEAQARGYAEADRGDVEGDDAVNKVVILGAPRVRCWIAPQDVQTAPPTLRAPTAGEGSPASPRTRSPRPARWASRMKLIARTEIGADGRPARLRRSPRRSPRTARWGAPTGCSTGSKWWPRRSARSPSRGRAPGATRRPPPCWPISWPWRAATGARGAAPAVRRRPRAAAEGRRRCSRAPRVVRLLPSVSAEAFGGEAFSRVEAVNGGAAVGTSRSRSPCRAALAICHTDVNATLYPSRNDRPRGARPRLARPLPEASSRPPGRRRALAGRGVHAAGPRRAPWSRVGNPDLYIKSRGPTHRFVQGARHGAGGREGAGGGATVDRVRFDRQHVGLGRRLRRSRRDRGRVVLPAGKIAAGNCSRPGCCGPDRGRGRNFDVALRVVRRSKSRTSTRSRWSIGSTSSGSTASRSRRSKWLTTWAVRTSWAIPVGTRATSAPTGRGSARTGPAGRTFGAAAHVRVPGGRRGAAGAGTPVEEPETSRRRSGSTIRRRGQGDRGARRERRADRGGHRGEIFAAYRDVARLAGIFCEPASAASLAGVHKLRGGAADGRRDDRVRADRHGLKDPQSPSGWPTRSRRRPPPSPA